MLPGRSRLKNRPSGVGQQRVSGEKDKGKEGQTGEQGVGKPIERESGRREKRTKEHRSGGWAGRGISLLAPLKAE